MKKLIIFVIIFISFVSINNVSLAQDASPKASITDITKSGIFEKYVKVPFQSAIKSIDEFRLTVAKEFQKKTEAYKAKKHVILENSENVGKKVEEAIKDDTLKETQDYVNSDAGNPISLIWITILIYVFTFLAYTFTTAYIFYTIAGLAVFLILRFIWTYLL